MSDRVHLFSRLCVCVTVLLCVAVATVAAEEGNGVVLTEDFEAYQSGTFAEKVQVTGQGPWRENAYGSHPANIVVHVDQPGNAGQVLASPGFLCFPGPNGIILYGP